MKKKLLSTTLAILLTFNTTAILNVSADYSPINSTITYVDEPTEDDPSTMLPDEDEDADGLDEPTTMLPGHLEGGPTSGELEEEDVPGSMLPGHLEGGPTADGEEEDVPGSMLPGHLEGGPTAGELEEEDVPGSMLPGHLEGGPTSVPATSVSLLARLF